MSTPWNKFSDRWPLVAKASNTTDYPIECYAAESGERRVFKGAVPTHGKLDTPTVFPGLSGNWTHWRTVEQPAPPAPKLTEDEQWIAEQLAPGRLCTAESAAGLMKQAILREREFFALKLVLHETGLSLPNPWVAMKERAQRKP